MNELTEALNRMIAHSQVDLMLFGNIFLRVSGVMAALPIHIEGGLNLRVKLMLALFFSFALLGAQISPIAPDEIHPSELLLGLAFGALARIAFGLLLAAGNMISQFVSLPQALMGTMGELQAPLGALFTLAGMTVAISAGALDHVLAALLQSYRLYPLGAPPDVAALAPFMIAQAAQWMLVALVLTGPFLLFSWSYAITLAVMSRYMPFYNLTATLAPAYMLGAMLLAWVICDKLIAHWIAHVLLMFRQALGG